MNEQTTSIVRSLLKIGGTWLATRGIALDNSGIEAFTGSIVTLIGIAWSAHQHRKPPAKSPK